MLKRKLKQDLSAIDILEEKFKKNLFSMRSDFLHPYVGIKLRSYQKTLDFIEENMADSIVCNNRNEIFNYCLKNLQFKGLVAEFGVKSGTTINQLASKEPLKKQTIYGFDSFEGIPENWSGTKTLKGQLTNNGKLPKVNKNVKLIKGWFKDTLPEFIKDKKENFSLIHIDCDLYSSTKDILDAVNKKITCGTIIIFDEYFNYPNWQSHEHKAFQQFLKSTKKSCTYLTYAHTQIAIMIK